MMSGFKIPIEEKRAYVERIDKKALDENISTKRAAEKLNMRYYTYWDYKKDLRLADAEKTIKNNKKQISDFQNLKPRNDITTPHKELILNVNTDIYEALEKESAKYLIPKEHIAQICLYDVLKKRIENNNKKEGS